MRQNLLHPTCQRNSLVKRCPMSLKVKLTGRIAKTNMLSSEVGDIGR